MFLIDNSCRCVFFLPFFSHPLCVAFFFHSSTRVLVWFAVFLFSLSHAGWLVERLYRYSFSTSLYPKCAIFLLAVIDFCCCQSKLACAQWTSLYRQTLSETLWWVIFSFVPIFSWWICTPNKHLHLRFSSLSLLFLSCEILYTQISFNTRLFFSLVFGKLRIKLKNRKCSSHQSPAHISHRMRNFYIYYKFSFRTHCCNLFYYHSRAFFSLQFPFFTFSLWKCGTRNECEREREKKITIRSSMLPKWEQIKSYVMKQKVDLHSLFISCIVMYGPRTPHTHTEKKHMIRR